jgi:hypothetical protein
MIGPIMDAFVLAQAYDGIEEQKRNRKGTEKGSELFSVAVVATKQDSAPFCADVA